MKISDEHIKAIQTLGYTADEARFLYVVATHSGYFLPRQFIAFTGASWGKRSQNLIGKVERHGHATWREYLDLGGVYHLFSKTLYRLIERENLRNRRRHSTEFIRTRLLLLDFIIATRHHEYLETEQDKVRFFCDELGIPKKALPAKTYEGISTPEATLRYFVDKFPLFLDSSNGSSSPVVTLSYVDPGQASLTGFANHLNTYVPLFRHLVSFRFLYIASSSIHFMPAEKCFRSVIQSALRTPLSIDVLRYVRLRLAWERKEYGALSADEIEWLDQASQTFAGPEIEALYAGWKAGEIAERDLQKQYGESGTRPRIEFSTYLVSRGEGDVRELEKTG